MEYGDGRALHWILNTYDINEGRRLPNLMDVKLVYSDKNGGLYTDQNLLAVGINGRQAEVADQDWIDLPTGGEVFILPGRSPLGYAKKKNELEVIDGNMAVAAILPVGYTRCLLPGYEINQHQELPLFGYTAVGAAGDKLKVAALKTDDDLKWNPVYYNTSDLPRLIAQKEKEFPRNRILKQLAKCAIDYHCLTAQNIFYQRWEAGIPVSPVCNADCLGCISKQPAECCPSPQGRINFIPSAAEIAELALPHLESGAEAIISFGQGCEGEPALQKELLVEAIKVIRQRTTKGTININSNAGYFQAVREMADAGLDSIRVSLFSAVPENYNWYHRPKGYTLDEVEKSLKYAADQGLMVAINLLFYPGFTNQKAETEALYGLIARTGLRQVQLRNLNLDPEKLSTRISNEELPTVAAWLERLEKNFPELQLGNYTQPIANK